VLAEADDDGVVGSRIFSANGKGIRMTSIWDRRTRTLGLAAIALLAARYASASTELPSPYDARSVGMGGTGIAHVHNGASIYHNPAALHETGAMAATLSLSPGISSLSGPINGPDTSVSSKSGVVPLFLVGGAYRITHRLVVGAALYPTGGFGATYDNVAALGGQRLKVEVGIGELSPVVTYSVLPNLAVSLGYRITRVSQSMSMPVTGPDGQLAIADLSLTGTSFLGAQAALYYRPIERLRLGAVYRSKVTATLDGSMTVAGARMDASTKMSSPHGVKIGAAFDAIPNRLLLAADFKVLFYSESSKEMVTTTTTPAGPASMTQRLNWKDAFSGYFGAELLATPRIPVRAGYNFTTSATAKSHPSPLIMPPGVVHGPSAGVGLRLATLDLDVGAYYSFGKTRISGADLAPDAGAAPGEYGTKLWIVAASATYRR
jgi:long-chain fatty acid transport protein